MSHLFNTTGWQRGPNATSADSDPTLTTATLTPPTVGTGLIVTEGYRGIRFMVVGTADSDDCDLNIFGVERSLSAAFGGGLPMYITQQFLQVDTVVQTATTVTGVAGGLVTASEKFSNTYTTLAISAYGLELLKYVNGTETVLSGGPTTIGCLQISDLGNIHGVVATIQAANTQTGAYFSILYKLDR